MERGVAKGKFDGWTDEWLDGWIEMDKQTDGIDGWLHQW